MKDVKDELVLGVVLGVMGAVALASPDQSSRRHQQQAITRELIPITWDVHGSVGGGRRAGPHSSFIKKTGFEFAISGHTFYAIWDTGNTAYPGVSHVNTPYCQRCLEVQHVVIR